MPDYLPLCAFRQGLLPAACRSCMWWLTTGDQRFTAKSAAEWRRRWMASLESTWGPTGLLLVGDGPSSIGAAASDGAPTGGAPAPASVAAISFAPPASLPRLREFPFGPFPAASAFLFCLMVEEGHGRFLPRRLLHKALSQLKGRGIEEVFAIAALRGRTYAGDESDDNATCRFFSVELLAANGFEELKESASLILMRTDLRGLLSLIGQVETAVRRVLRKEPTPSPAAWTRRGF